MHAKHRKQKSREGWLTSGEEVRSAELLLWQVELRGTVKHLHSIHQKHNKHHSKIDAVELGKLLAQKHLAIRQAEQVKATQAVGLEDQVSPSKSNHVLSHPPPAPRAEHSRVSQRRVNRRLLL